MFPRLWKVISTGWPCRTCSTGPGTVPLNVQARKRTPGAISTVRSLDRDLEASDRTRDGGRKWAGNGTSVRPPCARSRRLRRSGAAAELRDGRRGRLWRARPDRRGACSVATSQAAARQPVRCTARSSLSGSLAPVFIAALLELIDGVYAHPSFFVWVVAPVSASILLKTFRLCSPGSGDQRPRALPRVGEIAGRTVSPPLAAGTHSGGAERSLSHPLAKRERPCSRVSVKPSLHRRAGPPAVRRRTSLTA